MFGGKRRLKTGKRPWKEKRTKNENKHENKKDDTKTKRKRKLPLSTVGRTGSKSVFA